jgi:hypothetical protein
MSTGHGTEPENRKCILAKVHKSLKNDLQKFLLTKKKIYDTIES